MNFLVGVLTGFIVFTESGRNMCNKITDKMIETIKSNMSEQKTEEKKENVANEQQ